MTKVGILVHVYHLGALDWDKLMFGDPENDAMGSFATLAEVVLRRMPHDEITSIVLGSTDMQKDGLSHGEYAKQYMLSRYDELAKFSRLGPLLHRLTDEELHRFHDLLENIEITPTIKNTAGEISAAVKIFADAGVEEAIHIASLSHAPRCIQLQSAARADGTIPPGQLWLLRASDAPYADADPFSTLIFEAPHRDDDPMLGFEPKMVDVMRPYQYALSPENKQQLIQHIDEFMQEHIDTESSQLPPK